MIEHIPLRMRILSPVHLGCDEVFEPTGFKLDTDRGKLLAFDPLRFISGLSATDKETFTRVCAEGTIGSIMKVYQFMKQVPLPAIPVMAVDVCRGFLTHYEKTMGLSSRDQRAITQELNNFAIGRTAFRADDGRPYVPGSAVKGALRTAMLNLLDAENPAPVPFSHGKDVHRELEAHLQGMNNRYRFQEDPFSLIKVSDFMPTGEMPRRIVYAVNKKKRISPQEARGPQQIMEIMEAETVLTGSITISTPVPERGVASPLSWNRLWKAAEHFFTRELQREDTVLCAIGAPVLNVPVRGEQGLLLRLGRHSGAECVTIERHRNIRIMKGRGQGAGWDSQATTLWLAAEERAPQNNASLRPFGWVLLEQLTPEMEETEKLREAKYQATRKNSFRVIRADLREMGGDRSSGTQEMGAFASCAKSKDTAIVPTSTEPGGDLSSSPRREPEPVVWERARLTWKPSTRTVEADMGGRKAVCRDVGLIPEAVLQRLQAKKKKDVFASITVIPEGRNAYRIVKVTELS